MDVPIELYRLILEYADFLTQIRLRCVCKLFHQRLEIHDFYSIDEKYSKCLSDEILYTYPFITKLNAGYNMKITDVNHLTKLEVLNAVGQFCGIDNAGITNLDLRELNIDCNQKITKINHMTNLNTLVIRSHSCAIESFSNLNLKELHAGFAYVPDISHMTKLEILSAHGSSWINDEQIKNLNLIKLFAGMNSLITTVNHMTQLEILHAGYGSGINDAGIANINLKILDSSSNPNITNVNHMTRLEELDARWSCGIDDAGIAGLSLKKLTSFLNPKITNPQ